MTGPGVQDPTSVGPYRLVQRLGEGGMGVVHLALDPGGRAVALKLLRTQVAADPEARLRLTREVETLRRVRHARVAEVLDADVAGQRPYLVTRFVPGKTLDQYVRDNGPLPPEHVADVGRGLAAALQAIHAAGVVHRDIKPANVMLVDGQPVLIDFGIAHITDESRITMTGLVMGTPGYLSPEVVDGHPVSWATDWWGWAATLAFAASGRPPFGTGPIEVVLDRVHRGAADLDGVDVRLRPVLTGALACDPRRRAGPGQLLSGLATAVSAGQVGDPARTAAASEQTVRQPPPGQTVRQPPPGQTVRQSRLKQTLRQPPPRLGPDSAGRSRTGRDPSGLSSAGPAGRSPVPPPPPYLMPPAPPLPAPPLPPPPGGSGYGQGQDPGPGYQGDQEQDGRTPAAWEPPAGGAGPVRPTGTLLGALAALTGVGAVAPVGALVIAAALMITARTVDRTATELWRRRQDAGPRAGDIAVAVVALPWRLVQSTVSTALALVLPLLVGVSVAFITSIGGPRQGEIAAGTPSTPGPLAAATAAALLMAWWGPGGGTLRRGSRAMARTSIRTRGGRITVWVLLALVVLSAVMVVSKNQTPTMMFWATQS
jgi:serine/threonine protein kinase